jgi:hypothetical protein
VRSPAIAIRDGEHNRAMLCWPRADVRHFPAPLGWQLFAVAPAYR